MMRSPMGGQPPGEADGGRRPATSTRVAIRTAIAALGLVAVYVGGANLALNTDTLQAVINRKPEKLLVEWQGGSTLWPGRVHIEGLRIRGQSKKVQWQMTLHEGDFRLSVLDLLQRRIHVRGGSGSSFSFVTRPRLDAMENPPPEAPHWAEIEGLENPPDPPPEVLYPPKTKGKEPWHIVVDQVVLSGDTRFFLGPVEVVGEGTVIGGVDYRLRGGPLGVPLAKMDLHDVRFAMAEQALMEDGTLAVDARLVSHMRAEARGRKILSKIVGSIDLRGDIASLRALNDYIPEATGFAFEAGSGTIEVLFEAPSEETSFASLKLDLPDGDLVFLGHPIRGDILVESHGVAEDRVNGVFRIESMAIRLDEVYSRETWQSLQSGEIEGDAVPAPWWARFAITEGRIALGEPSRIDAVASVGIADTKPLFGVLLDFQKGAGRKAPKWLRMVPNVADLQGTMVTTIDPSGIAMRDVELQGEGLKLKARLQSSFGKISGVMYVRFKGIPLGLELLPEGGKSFKLIQPLRWYQERTGTETQGDDESDAADAPGSS